MTQDMTHLLKIYGANADKWPEALREDAANFIARNPHYIAKEAALDAALDSYAVKSPSDLLSARILNAAKTTAQDAPIATADTPHAANDRAPLPWKRLGAVAAALLVALTIGIGTLSPLGSETAVDDGIYLEAALDLGVEDVYRWVEGEDS